MYIKKSIVLLTVLTFPVPAPVCNARMSPFTACAWEQYIDVFIQGLMDAGSLDCKVSNRRRIWLMPASGDGA